MLLLACSPRGAERDLQRPHVAVAPARIAGVEAPGWREVRRLTGRAPRLFPALRVLHDPGPDVDGPDPTMPQPTGTDYVVDPRGETTPIPGNPFSSEAATSFVDVVGPWPTRAWGRATIENALYGSVPVRSLMEWNGREWSELYSPTTLLDEGQIHLESWGPGGAVALPFLFTELIGESSEPSRDVVCDAGVNRLGAPADLVPALALKDCGFSVDAFGVSTARDAFVAGRSRFHAGGAVPSRWGPLELQRWSAGATTPARDDLDAALGYAPVAIEAWDRRTLLVVGASDAYLAVMTPESPRDRPNEHVVVLHFDGRTWSQTLRSPPPWAGMELAADGSIWAISGGQIYVKPPPGRAASGFAPVPPGTARDPSREPHRIVPLQVMPWRAGLASVIGRWDGQVALFTVTVASTVPEPAVRR